MSSIKAYFNLWKDDTAIDLFEELDFTIARTNFQANPRERYLYQSYRSMIPFYNFLTSSTAACLILYLSKFKRIIPIVSHQSGRSQMVFSILMGTGVSLSHSTMYKPREFQNVCNLEDNFYGVLARTLLNTHPDGPTFHTALTLSEEVPTRAFYAVPNFQFSGLPAVVAIHPDDTPPVNGVPISPQEFFDDITSTINDYRNKTVRKVRQGHRSDALRKEHEMLELLKGNINAYLATQGIQRPPYFKGLEMPKVQTTPSVAENKGVNYMHVYQDNRETGGHDIPFGFSSATDMMAHYSSPQFQGTLPPDPMQQYKFMEDLKRDLQQPSQVALANTLPKLPTDVDSTPPLQENALSTLLLSEQSNSESTKH